MSIFTWKKAAIAGALILIGLGAFLSQPWVAEGQVACPVRNGCTGTSTVPAYGQILIGTATGIYAPRATSTLGISTSDLIEGTGLFWTNARFDARLAATTSLPNLSTLLGLTSIGTIGTGVWQGTPIGDAYLVKSGDWTGTFGTRIIGYKGASVLQAWNDDDYTAWARWGTARNYNGKLAGRLGNAPYRRYDALARRYGATPLTISPTTYPYTGGGTVEMASL